MKSVLFMVFSPTPTPACGHPSLQGGDGWRGNREGMADAVTC